MKITDKIYLYAWEHPEKGKINIGKKVSSKDNYISSATSHEFWRDWSNNKLEQYCIFETEDEDQLSAAEWWALDYGIRTRGVENFYNVQNNAHRGDQSLVTPEIMKSIVDYFDGKLKPEIHDKPLSLAENIIHKVENGEYEIHQVPVFEIQEYTPNQVREVTRNVEGEDEIIKRYLEDPQRVKNSVSPMVVMVRDGNNPMIVNGHTRLAAASRCKGWDTLPVAFIDYSEFGETEDEIKKNLIIAGSYANRESYIYTKENTDEDLLMQMNNVLAIANIDIGVETARDYAKEYLMSEFGNIVASKSKLNGLIRKLFNKYDKEQANIEIQANLITYSDADLRKYSYDNYESKGIAAIKSTFAHMNHMQVLGHAFNHTLQYDKKPEELAIILHYRTKHEYQKEQNDQRAAKLKKVIERYNLPVVVDVLPAFA